VLLGQPGQSVCLALLRGGAAKVDITPPVGVWLSGYRSREKPSDGIEDPLYAKALVLDDGPSKVAIVSVDLLWVPLQLTRSVRQRVEAKTGIAEDSLLICATHTHFGPKIHRVRSDWPDTPASDIDESYLSRLENGIVEAIITAASRLGEVKIGAVTGRVPEVVYNRRTRRPDGTVAMTFRLPAASPDLTFGPTDPQVNVLRVEDSDGSLVAAVVNFACHPVSGAREADKFFKISADYPGHMARVVEQIEGGICLFALGTAGNMNPVRLGRTNPRAKIGKALGGEVVRRIQFAATSDDITLKAMRRTVELPLKRDAAPAPDARPNRAKHTLTTEIQALRLGGIHILGLPGEVLVEIGLDIRKKAGIEKLFIISLSNDACGYICPRQAYKEGGYEPGTGTNLAEGAGEIITEQALKLLDEMK